MTNTNSDLVPNHVGLILDGNRRWAKQQGMRTYEGHKKGYSNLKDICKAGLDRGINYVSAFIFSTENWNRSKDEVNYLMDLAYDLLVKDLEEIHKENIRVLWLGTADKVSTKLQKAIQDAIELTKNNSRGTLVLCFNYGGQQEIVDAAKTIMESGLDPAELTVKKFAENLYAPEVPPVDLLVRTSGEFRLSGYMLWRAAYAELWFTDKYWPDFSEADLDKALIDFANRKRRFGT